MGLIPMVLVGCFLLFGFLWYWFYARDKIWREYSLMHVMERITDEKSTTFMMDEELRSILIKRDDIDEKHFEMMIRNCKILDLFKYLPPDKLFHLISKTLAKRVNLKEESLYKLLKSRGKDSNVVIHPGIAIFSNRIKGHHKFEIVVVRTKKGLVISKDIDPIHCIFIILATSDYQSYYYHTLMWLVQISDDSEFEKKWISAKNSDDLREVILQTWIKKIKS
jgi:mannitol/fructose-specific phosphotransferase system IIA component (Ntr-type)